MGCSESITISLVWVLLNLPCSLGPGGTKGQYFIQYTPVSWISVQKPTVVQSQAPQTSTQVHLGATFGSGQPPPCPLQNIGSFLLSLSHSPKSSEMKTAGWSWDGGEREPWRKWMSPTSSPCPSNLYPIQGPQEGNQQLAAHTVHEVRTSSMQLQVTIWKYTAIIRYLEWNHIYFKCHLTKRSDCFWSKARGRLQNEKEHYVIPSYRVRGKNTSEKVFKEEWFLGQLNCNV